MIHAWRYLKLSNTGRGSKYELQGETVKSLHGYCFHSRETWQSSRATDSTEVVATDSPLHVFEPRHHTSIFSKEKCSSKMIALPFQDINVAGFQSIVNHFSHVMFGKAPFLPSGLKIKMCLHFTPQELELAEVLKAKVLVFFFRWKNWNHSSWKQDVVSQALWQATWMLLACDVTYYHLDICLVCCVYQLDLLMCLFMHVFR